jgi:hypothetical protein
MLSCISFFNFIRQTCATAEFARLMILYTKQAQGTPRSLSKSDRVHVVRQGPLVCRISKEAW